LQKYCNTFSVTVPDIKEVCHCSQITQGVARKKLVDLAFCTYLKDGLLKLSQDAKCGLYILDMPWNVLWHNIELLASMSHLNYFNYEYPKNSNKAEAQSTVIDTILSLLDISSYQTFA
jgi:hypothetical protein